MKVKELLNEPSKWTKGTWARNEKGEPVYESDCHAVCWCLIGAIRKCYGSEETEEILKKVRSALKVQSISDWQDRPERNFYEIQKLAVDLDI